MLIVHLLAFACLVVAVIGWVKTGFEYENNELWFFGAILTTGLFSAYSLVLGIAGVCGALHKVALKLISLL